jgi:hypothetical protein
MDHAAQRRDAVASIRNVFDPQHSVLRYTRPLETQAPVLSYGPSPAPIEPPQPHVFGPETPTLASLGQVANRQQQLTGTNHVLPFTR